MTASAARRFHSLGFGESAEARFEEPDRIRFFDHLPAGTMTARGAGLSLAGAGFGPATRVVGMRAFDRILAFDPEAGTLEVEAGASLGKLFGFLTPRGWSVAVQPGYPGITIGGCIAGNVHGKSQYKEGCFGDWVESLTLIHPRHGRLTLSADSDPELFELTIGGFGLTGFILSARLRLARLSFEGAPIRGGMIEPVPVDDLAHGVRVMTARRDEADFLYSWHDMAAGGRGRGLVFVGRMTTDDDLPPAAPKPEWHHLRQDIALPFGLMNRGSIIAMNRLYRRLNQRPSRRALWPTLFPFVGSEAYFYLYGRRGFIEHQVLIPPQAVTEYLDRFAALTCDHAVPIGLATLKLFKGRPRLLRFDGDGVSLAVEVPRGPAALGLFAAIDALDCELGCRANALKEGAF